MEESDWIEDLGEQLMEAWRKWDDISSVEREMRDTLLICSRLYATCWITVIYMPIYPTNPSLSDIHTSILSAIPLILMFSPPLSSLML